MIRRCGNAPRTSCGAHRRNVCAGFTLVEILIALAVFAVVSSSLLTSASRMLSTTTLLRDKTIAEWIATNEMSRLRSNIRNDKSYPAAGRLHADVRMADMDWRVEIEIADTENQNVRRVNISIARDVAGADPAPIHTLVGFVGKY